MRMQIRRGKRPFRWSRNKKNNSPHLSKRGYRIRRNWLKQTGIDYSLYRAIRKCQSFVASKRDRLMSIKK